MKRLPQSVQFTQFLRMPVSHAKVTQRPNSNSTRSHTYSSASPDYPAGFTKSRIQLSDNFFHVMSGISHSYITTWAIFGSRMATPITTALEEILNQ